MRANARLDKSAWVLCLSELFASFPYIGVISVLILLFTGKLHLSADISNHIIGNVIPVTLITGLAGGIIGYRYLPLPLAALIGLISNTLGYLFLIHYHSLVFQSIGFAFIAAGFGLFEPNVRILFGNNYRHCTNTERDVLFIKFRIFNVVGQFFGILVLNYLLLVNPAKMFIIASGSSLMALIIYLSQYKHVLQLDYSDLKGRKPVSIPLGVAITVLMIMATFYVLLQYYVPYLFFVILILLVMLVSEKLTFDTRNSRIRIYSVFLLMVGFFVAEICIRQCLGIIEFFNQTYVKHSLLNFKYNTAMLTYLEPFFIVLFFPVAIKVVRSASKIRLMPGSIVSLGLLLIALSFILLATFPYFLSENKLSPIFLVPFYMLLAMGEILIIPVLISRVYSWSTDPWKGIMMGIIFLAAGLSSYVVSAIVSAAGLNAEKNIMTYQATFIALGIAGLLFSIFLRVLWIFWNKKYYDILKI